MVSREGVLVAGTRQRSVSWRGHGQRQFLQGSGILVLLTDQWPRHPTWSNPALGADAVAPVLLGHTGVNLLVLLIPKPNPVHADLAYEASMPDRNAA